MINDTNYICYTPEFYYYFYTMTLPLLCLTSIIVPMGLLAALYVNRNILQQCKIKFRYGYLVLGYHQKKTIAKFWEIVVIYKKIATLALLNYFAEDNYTQGLLMLFTLLVYLMILKAFSPYESEILNLADQQITMTQCYIMIIALILETNRQTQVILWVGLSSLLAFNVYAIYFLFKGIFEDFKQDVYLFMQQHYYGQKCQSCCPIIGELFKQRKVSTSRV